MQLVACVQWSTEMTHTPLLIDRMQLASGSMETWTLNDPATQATIRGLGVEPAPTTPKHRTLSSGKAGRRAPLSSASLFKNRLRIIAPAVGSSRTEVKARANNDFGYPEEFVGKKKMKLLGEAADEYIYQNKYNGDMRFDIISITKTKTGLDIHHIKDVYFPSDGD